MHGRGLHADVLGGLQRQYPQHTVASLERAVNYNGGSVDAASRLISAVEVGDEDRCRPPPRSLTPADGWKTDYVPDQFVFPPEEAAIQSLPSRQYQMGMEKAVMDELQGLMDKAELLAQNRKNAGKVRSAAGLRPASGAAARPWQRSRPKTQEPPPEWQDTGQPCVLCRRKSRGSERVQLTKTEGLCAACHTYFVSLGASDRPDLAWLRWERDGVTPEPEPEPEPGRPASAAERRRASGMSRKQPGTGGFKPGGVAGAAARRHQAAINESRKIREETLRSVGVMGRGGGRPRSAAAATSVREVAREQEQIKSEVARFREKVAREKREEQEQEAEAKEALAVQQRRLAAVAEIVPPVERPSGAPSRSAGSPRNAPRSPGACFCIVLCCFFIVLCCFCAKNDEFRKVSQRSVGAARAAHGDRLTIG